MPKRLRSLLAFSAAVCLMAAVAFSRTGPALDPESKSTQIAVLRDAEPRYWKGNLHTHSLWSDGDDFPEMIADWYKTKGYDFLALTDHNILSDGEKWIDVTAKGSRPLALKKYRERFGDRWVETRKEKDKEQVRLKPLAEFSSLLDEPGKFLMIPGEEITHKFASYPVHMNAINLRDVIKPVNGPNVSETIQVNHRLVEAARKKNGWRTLTFLNHPNWGWGVKAEDMLIEELRYFEIFNGHPGVKNYGDAQHVSTERMWDIVNALRLAKLKLPIVYGMATDDAHGYHSFGPGKVNPGRGWVMVRSPYLTAEAMVNAMHAGDFYPTTGVTLTSIRRDKDTLTINIKGEPGVFYKTEFIATFKNAPLDSKPVVDPKTGKELNVTQQYSDEIGKVVAKSEELNPSYRFTGEELYVRAKITSTKAHPNPYQKGDVEVAWTQPMTP